MSKKDKSKFRKRIKAQILREMAQAQTAGGKPTAPAPAKPQVAPQESTPAVQPQTKPELTAPASTTTAIAETTDDPLQKIKRDLKKSAIIIGSILVIVVVLAIVDAKTNILSKASTQIFKALHIEI